MNKLVVWIPFTIIWIVLFILAYNWLLNKSWWDITLIVYVMSIVWFTVWILLTYLWYRVYKLWNIKLKLDNVNYKFWDEIKYDVSVLIKEIIPEQRNLYIKIIWVRKIRRWDSTHYDRAIIRSKKIDTLWNNFSEIRKNYTGTMKIPLIEELNNENKNEFNSLLKSWYQEYIKDNPELAWKISEQDYVNGSKMMMNTIASFVWTDLSKPNYDFYEVKVLLDDEREGLFEMDLDTVKKIYIS